MRSSARTEDTLLRSNAGKFDSVLDVDSKNSKAVFMAISNVINSYGLLRAGEDQILIQHFVPNINFAGVVTTCILESGAPYYVFNFDDMSGSTNSVTAGISNNLRKIVLSRFFSKALNKVEPALVPVLTAVQEIEELLYVNTLDIEFAVDIRGIVHIFQVRPVSLNNVALYNTFNKIEKSLNLNKAFFAFEQKRKAKIYGNVNIFSNMLDWNPAEIIGVRPKPLALSLYRYLITDEVWAQQRAEFGYRDVRPCQLILSFCGQPYINVRASLNSFIPAELSGATVNRLVCAYLKILADFPKYHDKVEFDVVFTVWTPNFVENASKRLAAYGVKPDDILKLESALKKITRDSFYFDVDSQKAIEMMNNNRFEILKSDRFVLDKIIMLLEDCRNLGSLAFAHAARLGFIAMTLLKSFVSSHILSEERRLLFLRSFNTVVGDLDRDRHFFKLGKMTEKELIDKYGHLRSGTYEITAKAYWEDPLFYLFFENDYKLKKQVAFEFTCYEKEAIEVVLDELGLSLSVDKFKKFLINSIQSREFVKFEFTRNLSSALDLCVDLGMELGLSREDMSYLNYGDLYKLKHKEITQEAVTVIIERRKKKYLLTRHIELPSVLTGKNDFFCFECFSSQPNFITKNRVEAKVFLLDKTEQIKQIDVTGKLILVSQADPGYDWLFGYRIAGLITKYGGVNSHMAIRAAELNLPAAIGVGEVIYENILNMSCLELDCANQIVREIL